ncbi:MAG TPA: zinc-dependent alcohol dehydrogenase family protein [Nocardioides sp.]|uniref:zinc-dependent alcohol dehydrogenase family protein n=1 Tax=uncultured Nocardioides sp. TaxID=198441 RepID=UPI000ECF0F87|nr:zinc-dependent alcohol dehydrogenase family protein [uncultured Nocardioides sp.]HCB06613.1 IMP dehydrogenase [Nocardioides sp.]HRD59718.1 zinc-dependent alcohol dehydrogenase family protein [Nocardioides sp.]HRI94813.1 zinc-dependent alcohol dehydrogenase family protein [Nocardioides sp.]
MRATTIHGPRDIRVEEVPDPVLAEPTDAIVQVAAGCICGSDLWPYRGENPIRPGATIGHECIGEVVEVGGEVSSFRPGDFVVVPFCHCDNTCPHCLAGIQSACVHTDGTASGQAELTRVAQADGSLVRTDGRPDPAAYPALLTLTDVMATGWHAAVSARVQPGSRVVVVGDGAVGLCGVLAASVMGAETIVAMSRHESRQRIATDFGATHIVEERGSEGFERVMDITDGVGADAVLECVGTDAAVATAFDVARPGATVGFVGVPHGVELPLRRMFSKNIGLAGGMAPVRRYLPELLDLVTSGRIDPGRVFDLTLPLDEVAEGYRAMDERRAIKVQINP